ncbi:antibiotic biosynthesis monooxygenase [Paraburkholderia sp. LEh10]|jgi:quinol monooxygenase YgiN|uniref:putative quinol monooxygenase n=1 Tax=Paraburkholderia sp. LEh10 TaxID=2821353 RepID=UPI001AEB9322|nr:putative quinol monooxygenase [Paraburkholderia sp. LEh10]MBP0589495.1 antibiotic biosynthesis monooxygenase [Paraburkholderia sp. LEh10]
MDASGQIVVVARWRVAQERVADVLQLVGVLREKSLTEPGCLGYEAFRSTDDPSVILLIERYRDSAAIDEHRNSPHYQQLVVDRIIPMLSARQVELLRA